MSFRWDEQITLLQINNFQKEYASPLRRDPALLGNAAEDVSELIGQDVLRLEAAPVAVALGAGSVSPELLADPLLQDSPDLAADGGVFAEDVEVAKPLAVKEGEALVGKNFNLVLDVLHFAEERGVVSFHRRLVLCF